MTTTVLRKYEALIIVHPDLAEKDFAKLESQLSETAHKLGGTIVEKSILGKRRLSYKVKKSGEGIALQIRFEVPPASAAAFTKAVRLMEPVLRALVIQEEFSVAPKPEAPVSLQQDAHAVEDHHGKSE